MFVGRKRKPRCTRVDDEDEREKRMWRVVNMKVWIQVFWRKKEKEQKMFVKYDNNNE